MSNLIPIEEITPDIAQEWSVEVFNAHLNRQPPNNWLREHPLAKGVFYLPIDKVEYLLRKLFKQFEIEVLREGTMFNSIYCAVRVHYYHPVLQKWMYHDGVGAWDVQTEKGESVADLSMIKSMAVAKSLPACKSAAIKDACDHFGDLFGANINRRGTLQFEPSEKLKERVEKDENILEGKDLEMAIEAIKTGAMSRERINELYNVDESAQQLLIEAEKDA